MEFGLAHHPAFADFVPADLELGFDQGKDGGGGLKQRQDRRQQQLEGDEGSVDDRKIDGFARSPLLRCRALVRSITTTRASCLSFQASWP